MATFSFAATPYVIGSHTVLRLPRDASARLPSRGQVMVTGTLNGTGFRSPLEPDGAGSHWLDIGESLQRDAGIRAGTIASLSIEVTKDWPEPQLPADWQAALDTDRQVRARWDAVTPLARWEWLRWINSTGQTETRQRRIAVSCSKLLAGERRPCCFNRNMCCVPEVSKNGVLLDPGAVPPAAQA